MKQTTFGVVSRSGFELHGKTTKRGLFLSRMEEITPWDQWVKLIEPFYPKRGNGRPPIGLERILRMYCIANWFNLSDVACEDALYDVVIFRRFCHVDLGAERVRDATTLMNFRHLLEQHQLGSAVFKQFGQQIQGGWLQAVNLLFKNSLNPYLNFHRPCFFPSTRSTQKV
jgi:transposase, IS5 family